MADLHLILLTVVFAVTVWGLLQYRKQNLDKVSDAFYQEQSKKQLELEITRLNNQGEQDETAD